MQYLTVQDIIWINALAMKSEQRFDYMKLEEASYSQYGYGGSTDVAAQAERLLSGLRQKAPFESGNEATAFVAFAAFLVANGKRLKPSAAKGLFSGAAAGQVALSIEDVGGQGHGSEVHDIVARVFQEHAEVVASLLN